MVAKVTSAPESLCAVAASSFIIHLPVDVIAGKNQHVLRLLGADGINVLVNRVRRCPDTTLADSRFSWAAKHFDELTYLAP